MSNSGYFDLSGVFNVQQNYITDLSNPVLYDNVNNSATLASYLLNLQNKVKTVSKNYADSNTSSSQLLTQQNEMKNIIDQEKKRLEQKKILVDQADLQEKRVALLNNTYRKQYMQYSKMVIVVILGVCIFIALRFITNLFAVVPSSIVYLLHIINIVVCMIVITKLYADMGSRDPIDYDRIVLPPPVVLPSGAMAGSSPDFNKMNFMKDMGICYSSYCCGENTKFDTEQGVCIPIQNNSKTSMNTAVTTRPSSIGVTLSPSPQPQPLTTPAVANIPLSTPPVANIPLSTPAVTIRPATTPAVITLPSTTPAVTTLPATKPTVNRRSGRSLESFIPIYKENELLPRSSKTKDNIQSRPPMEKYDVYK